MQSQFKLLRLIVDELEGVLIDCDNCVSSGSEWNQYLSDGSSPDQATKSPSQL
jgi:hypothetical protein